MEMELSANLDRNFESTDPKVAGFVEWVATKEKETWLSYLVEMGLNQHLSRYRSSSPFTRGTHLDTRIIQLIHQFWPELSSAGLCSFRWAVQRYIHDNKLIAKAFDYEEPPQRDLQ
jgi:hypothetical protein